MKAHRRALYLVLLAIMGTGAACERASDLGQLTGPGAPQFSKNAGAKSLQILRHGNVISSAENCSGPYNRPGGTLNFPGGVLTITRNAVGTATDFCAATTTDADGGIVVRLRAFEHNRPDNVVSTFKVPLRLTIDLSDAGVTDWTRVVVVYRNWATGEDEVVPTAQDKNGLTATGQLTHFSDYSPALQ